MTSQLIWLLIVSVTVNYAEAASHFTMPSPWAWVCRDSKCVKELHHAIRVAGEETYSLAACKLVCNPDSTLWPIPRDFMNISQTFVSFLPKNLDFYEVSTPTAETKALMMEAIDIYIKQIEATRPPGINDKEFLTSLDHKVKVRVSITANDTQLKLSTEEKYELIITTTKPLETNVFISAYSFFGARHALETLSQLIAWDESIPALIIMKDVEIRDSPAFPHRGLLIDTSRNFVSVEMIKKTIDAMSQNKLNVFHWHLTDTHSFPFISKREPLLALYGAYSPSQVYRPEDIIDIVHYATVRGVKVVPEFDAPAHVGSGWEWGPSSGLGDLALCINKEPWTKYCVEPPCGQLNPVNDNIYPILGNIYKDMSELFNSDIFHMGGDEVHMACWNETQEILDWLKTKDRADSKEDFLYLWSYFQNRSLVELDQAYGNKQPVVLWTSGLTEDGHADRFLDPSRYIIQIWTTATDQSIAELYKQGYKLIMSNYDAWYLDCGYGAWVGDAPNNWCSPYIGWQKVYENSPRKLIVNFNVTYDEKQILGGEAALWSEQVDTTGMEGKLWPRSAALGERLWSDPDTDWRAAEVRLYHQRQRMVTRGIMADALQPEWCHQNEGFCVL